MFRVVSAPPYAFAATAAGLDQWDLRSGRRIQREAGDSQLFTARIADLAYDAAREALWIVGSQGIARYDLRGDAVVHLEPPTPGIAAASLAKAVLEPAPDGGIYLGLSGAVFHADQAGAWNEIAIDAPVTAIHVDGDAVFVGTAAGLTRFSATAASDEPVTRVDCDVAAVRAIVSAPGGGVLVVGVADAGAARVALVLNGACATYRPSPEVAWLDVVSDSGRAIILTSARIYELSVRNTQAKRELAGQAPRRLSRRGMTLIPTQAALPLSRSPFELRALGTNVPPGAQTVALSGRELLVGTRSLGTARLSLEGSESRASTPSSRWLRREELADRATLLTVRCEQLDDCRVANGSGDLWGFDGERFVRRRTSSPVTAVVTVADQIVAARPVAGKPVLELAAAPATGDLAERVVLAQTRVPEGYELRRLKPGPGRSVLVGWSRQGAGFDAPLALVQWLDLSSDRRRTLGAGQTVVRDMVACGGRLFLATDDGVEDVSDPTPTRVGDFSSHRLACHRKQLVAATSEAVVRNSSGLWSALVPLARPLRDFAVATDGRVFIADEAGLGIWDGDRTRRYDVRRGLLENDLREIALDRHGRIWIRGAHGVGLFRI